MPLQKVAAVPHDVNRQLPSPISYDQRNHFTHSQSDKMDDAELEQVRPAQAATILLLLHFVMQPPED